MAERAETTTMRITPERAILDLRSASSPVISPDGSRIAYVRGEVDPESMRATSQVWIIDVDGANERRLTWTGASHSSPVWSPDGRTLAFVSKRTGDRPQAICLLPVDGGESRELFRSVEAPGGLAWSPDGGSIAFTLPVDPANPDGAPLDPAAPPVVRAVTRIDYKQDNRGYLNDTRLQVKVLDIASGDVRQLTRELTDHTDPQWSPDGAWLAVKVANRNGMCSQLGIVDLASGDERLLGPRDGVLGTWRWSQDGSFLLIDGDDENTAQTEYIRVDVASGERRRLTDDLAFSPDSGFPTISPPSQPVWLDERTALVLGTRAGASGLWSIDVESGELAEIQRWDATHAGLGMDRAGRWIVQTRSGLDGAGEIVVTARETGETRQITSLNQAFFAVSPPAAVEFMQIERGGETIDAWLHLPPHRENGRRYPVILDVHGGPHGNYGYSFNAGAHILATAGYIVVCANPRGSGTYGRRFANLVRGDWGGEDWLDLQAVLDTTLERPDADAERTGIYGYSYGGFMTSWAIGQTERFRAAVCGAPVFDMESFYGTSDIGHEFGEFQWLGSPLERREWMLERSPATHAHKVRTPTLIVHGEADERCPIGQGEQMFVMLKKAGVEVEFVRYPGGSHLMLRGGPEPHRIDYYTRVLGWFDRFLRPTP